MIGPLWHLGRFARTNDPDQLPCKSREDGDRTVDTVGDRGEIRITGAGDDPGMSGITAVESVVIVAVVGQHSPAESSRAGKHVRVSDSLVRPTVFVSGKDIMTECSQVSDDGSGKVLVRVEIWAMSQPARRCTAISRPRRVGSAR
jgi:hypothetical protein